MYFVSNFEKKINITSTTLESGELHVLSQAVLMVSR